MGVFQQTANRSNGESVLPLQAVAHLSAYMLIRPGSAGKSPDTAHGMHSPWTIVPSCRIRNSTLSWNSFLQALHTKLVLIPHSDKKFTSCVLNEPSNHSGRFK